jgi:Ca2+-binding EF-hand superfamily protein
MFAFGPSSAQNRDPTPVAVPKDAPRDAAADMAKTKPHDIAKADDQLEEMIISRFREFDSSGDGQITVNDLTKVLCNIGIDGSRAVEIMSAADLDKNGLLSYAEFTCWVFGKTEGARLLLAKADAAPYLAEYFEAVTKYSKKQYTAIMELVQGNSDEHDKLSLEADNLLKKALPALRESFNRHDRSGTGVLDREEASVFFSNVVSLQGPFVEMATHMVVKASLQMFAKLCNDQCPRENEKKLNEKKRVIEETVARQIIEYKANKAARDKAAFKVVDLSGHGTINFREFTSALTPDDELNTKFLLALGLHPPDPETF